MDPQQPEQPVPCQVLVTFEEPSSIQFKMQLQNVSPSQLLYLGIWLRRQAEKMMDKIDERQEIAVPQPAGIILPPGMEKPN